MLRAVEILMVLHKDGHFRSFHHSTFTRRIDVFYLTVLEKIMKFKVLLVVVSLPAILIGCAGMDYAMKNYSGVKVETWISPTTKKTFRIFDKPTENRMMITLGFGDASAQGIGQGLTLGIADTRTPEGVYQDAAIEWLALRGRACTATSTFLVVEPQYEVRYACTSTKATAGIAADNGKIKPKS